jgi:hypothetical protein
MKRKPLLAVLVLAAFLVAGCNGPFILGERDLKGAVLTYIVDGNGLDYATLIFNEDGTGGTFEDGSYTFGFATEAAETSGKYSDQSWYMDDGTRGTFTYNPETYLTIVEVTHDYAQKADATTTFEDDYEWRTNLSVQQDSNPDITEYSMTQELYLVLNSDFSPVGEDAFGVLLQSGGTWQNEMVMTATTTENGETTIETSEIRIEMTITGTEITTSNTMIMTEQVGTADPTVQTFITDTTYAVNDFFIAGQETGDVTFEEAWKEGNSVTFLAETTEEQTITYEGDTAPATPPTVDETTGIGSDSDSDTGWSWQIDRTGGETEEFAFTHFGDVIIANESFTYAYRGLE